MKYLAGVRGTLALLGMSWIGHAAYLRGSLVLVVGFAVLCVVFMWSLMEAAEE